MYIAGMLTSEPSEEEYKQAASATHDQVRLQAVELINMVINCEWQWLPAAWSYCAAGHGN